ncbi:helix-turn-helix domain-containing protein [Streptomyces sp. NBC_01565]|uniref:helix-turn-helix domain-containing protein n=1 Tax=unclassified Streptomyces TaxID=2593676 RepID=UPI0022531590|nr:helix-turn-helix domain-containing protein [Streptomyces sp. NBC_01565]MCX4546502.1 helix-turn-helix domain-containing protein [Streptomyces sp. NBC_01565]
MSTVAALAAVLIPAPRASADDDSTVSMPPGLFVPEARQWLTTSTGRVALDGYSWMQAVHWVAGSGLYEPRRHRSHGPRSVGVTTVCVAQELAALSPCRPGIEYLMRRTGLSERSVEYHLGMLREAGLLAYVVRGTRVRGEKAQASEFAQMIPLEFDVALGIRTAGEGTGRRMTGIAEAGRELMARLAKKASRKVRRPRSKTSSKAPFKAARKGPEEGAVTGVPDEERCTPMQVGGSSSSPAGITSLPSETTDIANGKIETSIRKVSGEKAHRGINVVGRRYQLAAELIREIPWLGRASTPRIAWVVRHIADAGWSAAEVQAWLHARGEVDTVHRASGLLATLLRGAHEIVRTPEARAGLVSDWRDSRSAAARRHQELEAIPHGPRTPAAQAAWMPYLTARQALASDYDKTAGTVVDQHTKLGPSAQEAADMRTLALAEYRNGHASLIRSVITSNGRPGAEVIFGPGLVRRALNIPRPTSPMTTARQ